MTEPSDQSLHKPTAAIVDKAGTLLIYVPAQAYRSDGRLFLENQSIVGMNRWVDHFAKVVIMSPVLNQPAPEGWSPASVGAELPDNLEIHLLPTAYRPDQFLKAYSKTRAQIAALIDRADYLSFSIGGLFGDWGSVAAFVAHRKKRAFAVWADRVESQVVRSGAASGPLRRRIRDRLYHRPMAWLERAVIRRASLGLFHGMDTFKAYESYSSNPQVVHDILLDQADHIAPDALNDKIARADQGPLRIVFAGRADPMKGPLEWVEALLALHDKGVAFQATWLGDGALLEDMKARLHGTAIEQDVAFTGFITDRQELLNHLRAAHVHMFCHKTLESPRNLIEALISATPIVGYDSDYARDLVHKHAGGALVPIGDAQGLAQAVADLAQDRARLAAMIGDAYADGSVFSSEAVFQHRSDVIKANLPGPAATSKPG